MADRIVRDVGNEGIFQNYLGSYSNPKNQKNKN